MGQVGTATIDIKADTSEAVESIVAIERAVDSLIEKIGELQQALNSIGRGPFVQSLHTRT